MLLHYRRVNFFLTEMISWCHKILNPYLINNRFSIFFLYNISTCNFLFEIVNVTTCLGFIDYIFVNGAAYAFMIKYFIYFRYFFHAGIVNVITYLGIIGYIFMSGAAYALIIKYFIYFRYFFMLVSVSGLSNSVPFYHVKFREKSTLPVLNYVQFIK